MRIYRWDNIEWRASFPFAQSRSGIFGEESIDDREEILAIKRLVDEVIGSGFLRACRDLFEGTSGHDDHRRRAGRAQGFNGFAGIQTADAWHFDIGDHEMVGKGLEKVDAFSAI